MPQKLSPRSINHSNPYQSGYKSLNIDKDKADFLQKTKSELKAFIRAKTKSHKSKDQEEEKKPSKFRLFCKKAFYLFLMGFGLTEDLSGNYIFSYSLFALIPNLADPYIIGMSVLYTLLNGILFYAFGVTYLKESLGLESGQNKKDYMEEYSRQLKLCKSINKLLRDISFAEMGREQYEEYIELAKAFNKDLIEKNKKFLALPDKESTARKVLKYAVVGFGFISRGIGSYFMANTILAALFVSLVGTPFGWGLIIFSVALGVGLYYATEVQNMKSLVNPNRARFLELKETVEKFEAMESKTFDQLKDKMHPKLKPSLTAPTTKSEQAPMVSKPLFHRPALELHLVIKPKFVVCVP